VYRPLLLIASYLLGTFPTARLVVSDVATRGSGNPGASNAFRVAGKRAGVLTFAGDALKGALATAAGLAVNGGGRNLAVACGVAAVVGHCFPPPGRHGRKGGKGVATAAGMAAVLYPGLTAATTAAWFAIARLTGKASVASLAAAAIVLAGTAASGRPLWEVIAVAGVATLVAVRHTRNVKALIRGEERSLR
jgi:glycerol-3-phosphate acyltransferase PlsY